MSERITTALDISGAAMIAVGVGLIWSLGAALIVTGVLTLAFSFLAALGGDE